MCVIVLYSWSDKCSSEQQFHKSVAVIFLCEKTGAVALVQPGLMAGRLEVKQTNATTFSDF